MKTILSLAVFVCAYTTSFCQMILAPSHVTYLSQNPQYINTGNGVLKVIRTADEDRSKWNRANYKMTIRLYDNDKKLLQKTDLSKGAYAYNSIKPRLVKDNNNIWLVYVEPSEKSVVGNIVAEGFDANTLKPLGKNVIVSQEELDESVNAFSLTSFDFFVKTSPDSKYHSLFIDNGKGDFFISCLGTDMKPLWKKKQSISGIDHDNINGMAISNEGSIFITAVKGGVADLSSFKANGSFEHHTIDLPEIKSENVKVATGLNGEIFIGGVGMKDSKNINNFFLATLTKDGSMSSVKSLGLPDSIIERLHKDGLAKEKSSKAGIDASYINPEIIVQANGRVKLILECKAGLGKDLRQYMAYGSLVIADFNAHQKTFLLIPKYVVGYYPYSDENQFAVAPGENKITLYYYDNSENLNRDLSEPQKVLGGTSDAAIFAAQINDDGTIQRKIINDLGD